MDGWVKLHRKSIDSRVFARLELWKLWCLCLVLANHRDKWTEEERVLSPVLVKRGQFITGQFALHKAYYPKRRKSDKSSRTVWRWLRELEKWENLTITTTARFSIVTVCNYGIYQDISEQRETSPHDDNVQPDDRKVSNECSIPDTSCDQRDTAASSDRATTYIDPHDDNVQPDVQQESKKCPTGVQKVSTNKKKKKEEEKKKRDASASRAPSGLLSWCEWWNSLHRDGLVGSTVNATKPSQGVQAGWRRVGHSKELREMLADRIRLREAIEACYCGHEGWFRLEKLLGAKNQAGEYIVRVLLDGGYRREDREIQKAPSLLDQIDTLGKRGQK